MKSILAAVALVGATALSGAAVLPEAASSDPGKSSASAATHTKRFVLKEIASHNLGRFTFAGSDKIMSRGSGDVVGFDSYTGKFYPAQNKAVIDVGIALKGGVIVGRVTFTGESTAFSGPILKGTGKYKGVRGTITGHDGPGNKTYVKLVYRL